MTPIFLFALLTSLGFWHDCAASSDSVQAHLPTIAAGDTVGSDTTRQGVSRHEPVVDSDSLLAFAEAAYRSGDYEPAVRAYEQLSMAWSDSAGIWHSLGLALYRHRKYSSAERAFRRSLKLSPRQPRVYNNLGLVLIARGRAIDAISAYFAALGLRPSYTEARYNLAYAYIQRQNFRMAEMQLQRIIRTNPEFVRARYALATILRQSARYDEAQEQLDAALAIDPAYVDARVEQGFLATSRRNYDDAVDDFHLALALEPDNARAHYGLGLTYTFQRKWVAAQLQSDTLAGIDSTSAAQLQNIIAPNYVKAYVERGFRASGQHRYSDAVADFRAALAMDPSNARARYGLGVVYARQQMWGAAQSQCDTLRRLDSAMGHRLQRMIEE